MVNFIIDTGSSVSILSSTDFEKVTQDSSFTVVPNSNTFTGESFTQDSVTAKGYTFPSVTISLGSYSYPDLKDVNFYVSEVNKVSVLGKDLLFQNDLVLDAYHLTREKYLREESGALYNSIPPHVLEVSTSMPGFGVQFGEDFTKKRAVMDAITKDFPELFDGSHFGHGLNVPPLKIHINEKATYREQGRRFLSADKVAILDKEIKMLLDRGIIKKVLDESLKYICNVVIVDQKDAYRVCHDLTSVNDISEGNAFPLPAIDHILPELVGCKCFATLDLQKGFFQLPLDKDSQTHTAFYGPRNEVYYFTRVPFGLKTAPCLFQSSMQHILRDLHGKTCIVYIDDIIVFAKDDRELAGRLYDVFTCLNESKVALNQLKCKIGFRSVTYLGYEVNGSAYTLKKERLEIQGEPSRPKTVSKLRSFLGAYSAFRNFIPNFAQRETIFAKMASTNLAGNAKLVWNDEANEAFDEFIKMLKNPKILQISDPTKRFFLFTDASIRGIGAVLCQESISNEVENLSLASQEPLGKKDNNLMLAFQAPFFFNGSNIDLSPVAILSSTFTDTEKNWSTIEIELYGIVFALRKWKEMVGVSAVEVFFDHKNLLYLTNAKAAKVFRWKIELFNFQLNFHWIAGHHNSIADYLSRLTVDDPRKVFSLKGASTDGDTLLLKELKEKLIRIYHGGSQGHLGIKTTVAMMKKNNHNWVNLKNDVKKFISLCPTCQINSPKSNVASDSYNIASRPWEKLVVDYLGPLPEQNGYKYILVCTDSFSRFTELRASSNVKAADFADFIINVIFPRYGVPRVIQSDNASNFAAQLNADLATLLGYSHVFSTPYNSPENGTVEVTNRIIGKHLRDFLATLANKKNWLNYIPLIQRILNFSYNPVIDTYPAQCLYGDRLDTIPISNFTSPEPMVDTHTAIKKLSADLAAVVRAVSLIREKEKRSRLSKLNKKKLSSEMELEVGDFVLIQGDKKHPRKLDTIWTGPFEIIDLGPHTSVTVKGLIDGKTFSRPKSMVKQFFVPEENALEYATNVAVFNTTLSNNTWAVQEIVSHKPPIELTPDNFKSVKYVVIWHGWSSPTEEPYDLIKTTSALIYYLESSGYSEIVPLLEATLPEESDSD